MFLDPTHMASWQWQHEFGCLLCLSTDATRVTSHFRYLPLPYVTRRHSNVNPHPLGAWPHLWTTP